MATTSSTATPSSQIIYVKGAQEFLKKNLVFYSLAQQKKAVATNSGRTVTWRRPTKLSAATTPLTEGTTPAGSNVSITNMTATLAQYGDFTIITDVVSETDYDPNVDGIVKDVLSYQMKETVDTIFRDEISSGAQVRYPNGHASGTFANTDYMNYKDFTKCVNTLKRADAPTFDAGLYTAVMSPDQEYDLRSDSATGGYIDITKFDVAEEFRQLSVGVLYGTNIKLSTLCKSGLTVNSVANTYETYFLAKDALGSAELDGNMMEFIVKSRGSEGSADPLSQRGSIGWKCWFAAKSLDTTAAGSLSSRIVKLYTVTSFS